MEAVSAGSSGIIAVGCGKCRSVRLSESVIADGIKRCIPPARQIGLFVFVEPLPFALFRAPLQQSF